MQFSEFVQQQGKPVRFGAGEHVFRQGDEDRSVYVLQKGLLKAYYLSDEGKENIKSFIQPGELIGSLASAYLKEDCSFSVVCLEPSVATEIEFDTLYAATKEDQVGTHLSKSPKVVDRRDLRGCIDDERNIVALRNLGYESGRRQVTRAAVPVISIGSLAAGGTGKTPLTAYVASRLRATGSAPIAARI